MKERCPHIKRRHIGDESWDFCELTERPSGRIKPCLLESSDECEIYGEFLMEVSNERTNNI